MPTDKENVKHMRSDYPATVKLMVFFDRVDLTKYLEAKLIETGPIIAGNIAEQRAMSLLKHRVVGIYRTQEPSCADPLF